MAGHGQIEGGSIGGYVVRESLNDYCRRMEMYYLLSEWDARKNAPLTPESVPYGSQKRVFWRCAKGHSWGSTVSVRTAGARCPYCSGKKPVPGETDLATTDPAVAAEWHPTKNGELTPQMVGRGSHKKVWWRCERGHEWSAAIYSRASGIGCPVCSGRRIIPGENDLAALYPAISSEWSDKNFPLTPESVTPGSSRRVWWQCREGHEWQATVNSRIGMSHGCPYCANRKVLRGFNDLATRYPKIAAQWHPTLNGDLTPDNILYGSRQKAWWLCAEGHVWKAEIASRTGKRKHGCPLCAGNVSMKWRARYDRELAELLPAGKP